MKFFFLIIFFFLLSIANAQVIKFNHLYSDTTPTMRNIVVTDTGYVIVGGGGSPVYILTAFVDSLGNLIGKRKIRISGFNLYHGLENSLVKEGSNSYLLASSSYRTGSNESCVNLYKFNLLFDTLWSRKYLYDTLYVSGLSIRKNSDGFYYLTGEKGFSNNDSGVLLIKIDSSGNLVWSKTYGGSWPDYGTKIVNTYDNKLLIGGYTKSFQSGTFLYLGDWYLLKTDTAGVNLWQNLYGNPNFNEGWVRSLINTNDSGFAIGGSIAIEYANYHARFLKLDKDMNIIIDRSYLTPSGSTVLYSIIELNSYDYITLGTETINNTKYGFLMKINSVGNIIWKRNYYASVEQNSTNYALALATTPDNGYAFTGYAYVAPNPQQMWLVKTDSLGCDGVHSCDDTTMFINASTLQDSVCFGDSVHITINFGGRSAPYTLQCTNGFSEDSIYYFDSGNDTISRTFSVLPQQENAYYNFTAIITDPWGATKTGQFSFYVKHCSTSVSLNDQDLLKFQVYPNPAKDNITISCSENIPATIFLLNIHGEILQQTTLQNQTTTFNVKNFADGIYVVKIVFVNGIVIKKVIKE